MMFYSDDPVRDAERYDRWLARQEKKRYPCCEQCDQPITKGHYFRIEGFILCQKCVTEEYGKEAEDYDPMGD